MRYTAKVYVTDVMDQVVVSGYVVDCDPMSDPDHQPHEFAYQTAGTGEDDPLRWLVLALRGACQAQDAATWRLR